MAEIKITAENFEQEVLQSKLPVLVDFFATWCGPCKMLAPHLEELAKNNEGKLKVGKVNVDEEQALASKFGVMSIPTLILFKNGNIVNKVIGVQPKATILEMITNASN